MRDSWDLAKKHLEATRFSEVDATDIANRILSDRRSPPKEPRPEASRAYDARYPTPTRETQGSCLPRKAIRSHARVGRSPDPLRSQRIAARIRPLPGPMPAVPPRAWLAPAQL